jgi:hypothetical protein
MNLIEQQNILRGLADDALKGEMGGGSVPPYLVLAEVNRRKSARERYEAANAKYRANQPTVAEELMGQKMPSGIDAAMPRGGMPMGGMMQGGGGMPTAGIDAAMPQPQQAFANGGIVGYKNGGPIGYEVGGPVELMEAYNQRLSGMDEDRKMAQKMALMNIGAQIMAGRSRNTLSNVGTGLSAALPSYQQSMERLNTQEMQAMRDQIDLARQMEQDQRSEQDRAFSRDMQTKQLGLSEQQLMPADVREALWYEEATPEQRTAYDEIRTTNQANENLRISNAFNTLNKTVERRYVASDGVPTDAVPSTIRDLIDSVDPTEVAAGRAQLQQLIKREAVNEFRLNYPDYGSFADKVEENLDKVGIGAPGGSTALPSGAILKAEDFF